MRESKKARKFIGHKIGILEHEGYPPKQAVAISLNMARAKGYKIGKKKRKR